MEPWVGSQDPDRPAYAVAVTATKGMNWHMEGITLPCPSFAPAPFYPWNFAF